MKEIEIILLEETAYGPEDLHGVIFGLLKHGDSEDPKELVEPILNLLDSGHLEGYYMLYTPGSGYKDHNLSDITREDLKKDLLDYIEQNKTLGFKEHPDNEYYFTATDIGYKVVEENE
jgi:hypothetical protein